MNRRSFLANTFTILAAATTYVRAPWKILPESNLSVPTDDDIWRPEVVEPCEIHFQWDEDTLNGEDNLVYSICPVGGVPGPYFIAPHDSYFARVRSLLTLRRGETQKVTMEFYDAAGHPVTSLPSP